MATMAMKNTDRPRFRNFVAALEDITEQDERLFFKLISTKLTAEQEDRIVNPMKTYPEQEEVLAVHWHPEFIPQNLIMKRIDNCFPNRKEELIIPTQHNSLLKLNGYAGVEMDCYSKGFNRKVQLLLHFHESKIDKAGVLESMLDHTFKYRYSQLFEFVDYILNPGNEFHLQEAADKTGADARLIGLIKIYTKKFHSLFKQNESSIPPEVIRNKLLQRFVDAYFKQYDEHFYLIAQLFLQKVKKIMKRNFSPDNFFQTSEVIEEVRYLGGGVVIPHPEQFWPILLAEYDVDGYEVWNPQSQEYTEFLIDVIIKRNKSKQFKNKPLLVFMGDDTHMGGKIKEPEELDNEKSRREIGIQPGWENRVIRRSLENAGMNRHSVIREYKNRLM